MSKQPSLNDILQLYLDNADLNSDGILNILDIIALVNIILDS